MSISKSIDTDYGVPATEWKVAAVVPVANDNTVLEATYNGFADYAAASNGMQPLTQMRVQIPNVTYADESAIDNAVLSAQTALAPG